MLFSAQKQNKTGSWQTRGFVRFWPIKYQRGPRESLSPSPPRGRCGGRVTVRPWVRFCSPPAAPGAAPSAARRPTPLRTRGGRRGPGRRIPTHPGPLSERALRRGPPLLVPRPPAAGAAPLPCLRRAAQPSPFPGARVGRERPSGSGSLRGRDKVSATRPDASRRRGRSQPDLLPSAPPHHRPRGALPFSAPPRLRTGGVPAGGWRGRSRRSEGIRGLGHTSTRQGWAGRGEARRGGSPNLPDCAAPRATAVASQRQRQSERGRGRVRRGLMEGPGSRRRRRPSLPPSLPPRLRATDGAAGGMTGNSWARAAESKYEHGRRAREDRGARPPRTGPAARPRRPPTPSSECSSSTAAARLPAASASRRWNLSAREHPSPGLRPKSRAERPTQVPPETPDGVEKRETTTRRPDSEPRTRRKTPKGFEETPALPLITWELWSGEDKKIWQILLLNSVAGWGWSGTASSARSGEPSSPQQTGIVRHKTTPCLPASVRMQPRQAAWQVFTVVKCWCWDQLSFPPPTSLPPLTLVFVFVVACLKGNVEMYSKGATSDGQNVSPRCLITGPSYQLPGTGNSSSNRVQMTLSFSRQRNCLNYYNLLFFYSHWHDRPCRCKMLYNYLGTF